MRKLTRGSQASSSFDQLEPIIAPIVFTFLAFFTRMWKIGLSPIVTWDEAQYVQAVDLCEQLADNTPLSQLWKVWLPLP